MRAAYRAGHAAVDMLQEPPAATPDTEKILASSSPRVCPAIHRRRWRAAEVKVGARPYTVQNLSIGPRKDGVITAITQDVTSSAFFRRGFAEVRVDPDLGTVHASPIVGACSAGRILNARTARSPDDRRHSFTASHGAARTHRHRRAHRRTSIAIGVKGIGEIGTTSVARADCQCGLARDRSTNQGLADHRRQGLEAVTRSVNAA